MRLSNNNVLVCNFHAYVLDLQIIRYILQYWLPEANLLAGPE